jgi:FMN reductase [NAD(P)H]
MEFRDVLAKRRIVRNYTNTPVAEESLDRIAESGLRGPSAGYSQGVATVVVTLEAKRDAIAALAREPEYLAAGFDPWISRAPAHIVIAVSEKAYRDRYREPDKLDPQGKEIDWPVPYWWVDAGCALMAMLLSAVDEGLAAGFLGIHATPELAALLELPEDYQPIGIVTIGHPAPDRKSSSLQRGRKPREKVIHREIWGGT